MSTLYGLYMMEAWNSGKPKKPGWNAEENKLRIEKVKKKKNAARKKKIESGKEFRLKDGDNSLLLHPTEQEDTG
ncbi:MAG: hypothetical protein NVV59_05895 [Chitinophagaceae bacterium]|nr:hypothetical protein [Chitinophagaceae bacterium]